jgi:hypothetical protein
MSRYSDPGTDPDYTAGLEPDPDVQECDGCTELSTQLQQIARVLRIFYLSPLSMSSVQPLLTLAEELNPGLKGLAAYLDRDIITPDKAPF